MRTSALLVLKTTDFSKFLVCLHGQGALSQCGQKAEGSIFRDFMRMYFMDGPLHLNTFSRISCSVQFSFQAV